MLHRVYPWKLFKDIEDMILDRRTGPEYPSYSSRLFTSSVPQLVTGDPIPLSAPPHTLGGNVPLDTDSLTPATKPLHDHLQAEDVQIPRPRSAPPQSNAFPGVTAHQSTTLPEPPLDFLSASPVLVPSPSTTPPCNIVPPVMDNHPAPELGPPQNPPGASISTFGRAKDFAVNNSLINTVAGNFNQTIFKLNYSEELFTTDRETLLTLRLDAEKLKSLVKGTSLRVS